MQGGKEHGVPILISEIHPGLPAERCQGVYVGDAILSCNGIDLQEAKHSEAVKVLSSLYGEIVMEVLYVAPDDSSDEDEADWENKDEKRFTYIIYMYSTSTEYYTEVHLHCFLHKLYSS